MDVKEERIRAITHIYYMNPVVRDVLLKFAKDREVVPRYFEGFGKRPDMLQYPSDVSGLVRKGATSFHASEELWDNPLNIDSDMSIGELTELRKGWDLLIDIDSKYLDVSKILARLIVEALEKFGVKNYGIKFSVIGETPILVRNKTQNKISLIPIQKAIFLLKKGEKLEVLSVDKKKKVVFSEIYDHLEHDEEIYEILHEQSKMPLKVTGHHSVFIFDKGKIVEKKVSDLKNEDFLVTFNSKNNPCVSKKEMILNKFQFGKNQYSKKEITKKVKINSELMRLIGYYLSEGHVTNIINQVGFTFNKNEKEYIDDCTKLLESITQRKISIRHPNSGSTQILIHSKEWATFFETFCGKKKEKHVPEFSWELPKYLFLEMLRGYIRGDGYKLGEYGIVVKSVALQLIREFVWLCNLNGISCSLSSEQNKPHVLPQGNKFKGSFVYILKIPKSELEIVEFARSRNKFSPFPRDRTFPIEGLKEVYHKIKPKQFNKHRVEQMTLKKKRANLGRIRKVIEWFKKYKSVEFDEKSKEIIRNYESLYGTDVGVVGIKLIKKLDKKEKVYDVSVKDTESFFGNDYPILLHNSGSKGFHIIVSGKAFPEEYNGMKSKEMFPEWPRAICEYLTHVTRAEFNKEISELFKGEDKKIDKEGAKEALCPECGRPAKKGWLVILECPICKTVVQRKDMKITKKRLKCVQDYCAGVFELKEKKDYFACDYCEGVSSVSMTETSGRYKATFTEHAKRSEDYSKDLKEEYSGTHFGASDLILVASRHLFRMPYSLHEKTALASIVLTKDEIESFKPSDANPLKIEIKEFMPDNKTGEGDRLLIESLEWKKIRSADEETIEKKRYSGVKFKEDTNFEGATVEMFPKPIKKLLKGLEDGRKRGLFVLLTFLKSINFSPEDINNTVREWNEKNKPPLKEGYVRSQIDWHLKQKKKILPPNYDNEGFYRDIGLIDKKQATKNPLVDLKRNLWKARSGG